MCGGLRQRRVRVQEEPEGEAAEQGPRLHQGVQDTMHGEGEHGQSQECQAWRQLRHRRQRVRQQAMQERRHMHRLDDGVGGLVPRVPVHMCGGLRQRRVRVQAEQEQAQQTGVHQGVYGRVHGV